MKFFSRIDKRAIFQGILSLGVFVFFFKLCTLVIPRLSLHASITFLLACALVTSLGYLVHVSREALRASDKLNDISEQHELLQNMINGTLHMFHDTIIEIGNLKKILVIYDNQDMRNMVKALSVCEQSAQRVSAALVTVAGELTTSFEEKIPAQEIKSDKNQPNVLNEEDRLAIERTLAEVNPFKETI
jgi:hypothetical protein